MKCHSCALATFQICIVYTSHSPFETFRWLCHVYLHGCEIACALTQTFAQCKIFLQGHALHRRSQGGLGDHTPQIIETFSHFVLKEAISETKWSYLPNIKYFLPPQIF